MTKLFEDYFSEAQAYMVFICMEYSEGKAQEIYIYGSFEPNMYTFKVFFKIQDKVLHHHKLDKVDPDIDTSDNRQDGMLDIDRSNGWKCFGYDRWISWSFYCNGQPSLLCDSG